MVNEPSVFELLRFDCSFLRRVIWFYAVCQCAFYGTLGINGLTELFLFEKINVELVSNLLDCYFTSLQLVLCVELAVPPHFTIAQIIFLFPLGSSSPFSFS